MFLNWFSGSFCGLIIITWNLLRFCKNFAMELLHFEIIHIWEWKMCLPPVQNNVQLNVYFHTGVWDIWHKKASYSMFEKFGQRSLLSPKIATWYIFRAYMPTLSELCAWLESRKTRNNVKMDQWKVCMYMQIEQLEKIQFQRTKKIQMWSGWIFRWNRMSGDETRLECASKQGCQIF